MEQKQKLEAKYGLFTAISMVIGQVIGSGIFFKVDDVLAATQGNSFAGLLGFLIVGVSVVFAAISMASYAHLIPKDGGILAYVDYRFGKKAAAFVGWIYLSLFYPLLTAVLFTVSGIYIANFIANFYNFKPGNIHYSLIGFAASAIFFVFNIFKPKASGFFQQITTVLKLIPLIFIAALGIAALFGGQNGGAEIFSNDLKNEGTNSSFWFLVAASFVPIAFAFDGWYIATQISGEIKNASKNLPKALVIGTSVVLIVYLLYYCGIVLNMKSSDILSLRDTYIMEFSRRQASGIGALFIQLFIIISVLGTVNGLLLASLRVPFQFYNLEDSKKFLNLGKVDEKIGMPINSAILAYSLIIFYLLVYFLSNTLPFFTERGYDISAIPVTFIYIVNGALIFGLAKLIRNGKLEGGKTTKYIMSAIALLGILVVLIGTATANNGLSYIVLSFIFTAVGFLFIRKN